jgi:hypothetical protein
MAGPPQEDSKPDGAAFDEFFESIGKKAEQLTINDNSKKSRYANGEAPSQQSEQGEEDQKVVDEIESLCMNCHENVSYSSLRLVVATDNLPGHHPFTTDSDPLLPRNYYHVLFLPPLQL